VGLRRRYRRAIGLVVFAVGVWRAGAWPGIASTLLAVAVLGAGVPLGLALGGADQQALAMFAAMAIALLSTAWLVVGAMHLGAIETRAPEPNADVAAGAV
jgi:hypothetical protein